MTGKLADVVMTVRNGNQIVRKYQPIVANPSTALQVASRAKLKALSQLTAVMAPVIAMPRSGMVSARNKFVKKNYALSSFANDTASINLLGVQLTDSVVSLPNIGATRTETGITAYLTTIATIGSVDVNRIVYAMFLRQADNTLRYVGSAVGANSDDGFAAYLPLVSGSVIIYAYGVRDNNENARAIFGNLTVDPATTTATLVVNRTLTEADITLTETRSLQIAASRDVEVPSFDER